MQLVHFGHSCILVDTGSARLLIDPGTFSTGFGEVRDLDAILITHRHFDHVDIKRLPGLVSANPDARVVLAANPPDMPAAGIGIATDLDQLGLDITHVRPGDSLKPGGATVQVIGGQHAVIHPDVPVIPNIGFVIDHGAFYHPGDSLVVPEQKIDVLAVPTGAPWLKIAEAVDFIRAIAPRVAIPIHEAVLDRLPIHYGWLERLAPSGTTFTVLPRDQYTNV